MTIVDGAVLKAAQHINLPNTVTAVNVFYYVADLIADQTDADVVDAIEARMEVIYGTLASELSDAISLGECAVYRLAGPPTSWELIGTGVPSVTFVNANEMLPHGVAMLTRGYTERSLTIGRKYIPAFTEEDNNDGTWLAAAITAMGLFNVQWGTTKTISANNDLKPAVWSTVTGFGYELTDEYVILAQPAYQRRRRPGVGI